MSEYQNTKNLLLKNVLQIGQKKFFFSKIKNTVSWTYVISGLNDEPIAGGFYEKKNCKKQINKNSEQEKQLKEKMINCMSNGKDMTIHLIVGFRKKTFYKSESIIS